jgi:Tfp pilus assembly protein FimT
MIRRTVEESGFSIVELIVAVAVSLVLGAIAIPAYFELQLSMERGNKLREFESDLRRAKSEAIARGSRAIFETAPDGRSYTVGVDDRPFNAAVAADEVLLSRTLGNVVAVSPSLKVIFDSRGFLIDEVGSPTTATIQMDAHGTAYASASLTPTGSVSFTGVD